MKVKYDSFVKRARAFVKSLQSHERTILLITITAVATLIISSLISIWLGDISGLRIPSIGTIRFEGVEGYWDENLTNRTGTCDWGTIWLGASKNITVYLRSISFNEITLNQATGNWTYWNSRNEIAAGPSNSTPHMYLTWDYDNSTLHPGEVIRVTLTLHARLSSEFIEFLIANDVKAFSFDIHIECAS